MHLQVHRIMEATPISTLLQKFVVDNHKEKDFDGQSAVNIFWDLLREEDRTLVEKVWYAQAKLYVKISNTGLKFELLQQRSTFMQQINQQLGVKVIKNIVFC